jgi:hypothetical protein
MSRPQWVARISRRLPIASATPVTIERAAPSLSCGMFEAASQTPANRTSRNPISAMRMPV